MDATIRQYKCSFGDSGNWVNANTPSEAAIKFCHRRDRGIIDGDWWNVVVETTDGKMFHFLVEARVQLVLKSAPSPRK